MTEKKETGMMVLAAIAMVGCCLLLTTLLAGGSLAFLGISLRNRWLLVVGVVVIIFAVILFILSKRQSK